MDELLKEIQEVKRLLLEQNLLKKDVLCFSEACKYLDISESHLYKLTSRKQIPHFCPQGKKLYFKRLELDNWLMQNRQLSIEELTLEAEMCMQRNKRR